MMVAVALSTSAFAQGARSTPEASVTGFATAAFSNGSAYDAMTYIHPEDLESNEAFLRNADTIYWSFNNCQVASMDTFVKTNEQGRVEGFIKIESPETSGCQTMRMRILLENHDNQWYVVLARPGPDGNADEATRSVAERREIIEVQRQRLRQIELIRLQRDQFRGMR
ncbi:hypothetical protein GPA21_18200 [Azoarcus taiwanensis]|uniref:Uncharacterized protein n=2 Tax=Azoarcus taiwanensis TaxID=666964 RepID=A0A972F9P0_9RHOO|nr:hypothetical protein [Azoarcus taiwanensis]